MICVYATPDCRQVHVRFDESEPTSRSPLVLVESFEDSDDDGPWDAVEMLCDPTPAKD